MHHRLPPTPSSASTPTIGDLLLLWRSATPSDDDRKPPSSPTPAISASEQRHQVCWKLKAAYGQLDFCLQDWARNRFGDRSCSYKRRRSWLSLGGCTFTAAVVTSFTGPSRCYTAEFPYPNHPHTETNEVMEVTFEEEFPNFDVRLSPQLRKQFYEKLKHLVVVIDTKLEDGTKNGIWDDGYTSEEEEDEEKFIRGGGVIMNSRGFILTCAQLIPPNFSKIQFRRVNDESFSECVLVARKEDLDLAIVRPVKDEGVVSDFGKFGIREFIDVGMEVFSIAHPIDLCYSLVIGQVSFPCFYDGTAPSDYHRYQTPSSRLVGFVVDDKGNDELKHLAKDLQLIQINNFHGTNDLGTTSFGAPVFDSRGRVIGLNTFVLEEMDFAIHMSVLEKFWKENVSEPQENGSDPQESVSEHLSKPQENVSEPQPPKRKKRKRKRSKAEKQRGNLEAGSC